VPHLSTSKKKRKKAVVKDSKRKGSKLSMGGSKGNPNNVSAMPMLLSLWFTCILLSILIPAHVYSPPTMGNLPPTDHHIPMFAKLHLQLINVYPPSFVTLTGHLPAKIISGHKNSPNFHYPCNLISWISLFTRDNLFSLWIPTITQIPTLQYYLNWSITHEMHHRVRKQITSLHSSLKY